MWPWSIRGYHKLKRNKMTRNSHDAFPHFFNDFLEKFIALISTAAPCVLGKSF